MKTKRHVPRTASMWRPWAIAMLLAPVSMQAQETEKAVSRQAKETPDARQAAPGGCVREQLASDGKASRGRIGVRLLDMNAELAKAFGLDRPRGALVSHVERGQPADEAGIRPGDIVLRVGGMPVENTMTLCSMVAAIKPGTRAEFEVWSDRKLRKVSIQISTD